MTKHGGSEPWRSLPAEVADLIEPELEAVTEEILETIAREVPEYARPLEGSFGRGIRTGVDEALRQFVALVRDPEAGRGRGARSTSRSAAASCGRAGPSTRCRPPTGSARGSPGGASRAPGREGGLDPEVLSLLAEAIFAYIDELSADSVEGYAEAQSEVEDLRRRRRRELAALLDRRAAGGAGRAARRGRRRRAGRCRARVAALACAEADLGAVGAAPAGRRRSRRRSDDGGLPPGPRPRRPRPGRRLWRAAADDARRGWPLGPAGAAGGARGLLVAGAGHPARVGRRRAARRGRCCSPRTTSATCSSSKAARWPRRMAARRLAPARGAHREGRRAACGRRRSPTCATGELGRDGGELHVHPQTARYRIARLRELLGDAARRPGRPLRARGCASIRGELAG